MSKKPTGKAIDPSSFFGGSAKNAVVKEKVREEKNVLSLKNQVCTLPLETERWTIHVFSLSRVMKLWSIFSEGRVTEENKSENSREEGSI